MPEVICRTVRDAAELAEHHLIRHEVFVVEQQIFTGDDLDLHDADPACEHVLGFVDGVPAGTVRLYPIATEESGVIWRGDRLANRLQFRRVDLGSRLVRFAVRRAGELGGVRMDSMIQPQNVKYFARLGWSVNGEPVDYLGHPHQLMSIQLHGAEGAGHGR